MDILHSSLDTRLVKSLACISWCPNLELSSFLALSYYFFLLFILSYSQTVIIFSLYFIVIFFYFSSSSSHIIVIVYCFCSLLLQDFSALIR